MLRKYHRDTLVGFSVKRLSTGVVLHLEFDMLLDVDAQPTARVHKTDKHVGEFILNRVFYPVLERPLVLDGVEIGSTPTMLAISLQRFTGLTL